MANIRVCDFCGAELQVNTKTEYKIADGDCATHFWFNACSKCRDKLIEDIRSKSCNVRNALVKEAMNSANKEDK